MTTVKTLRQGDVLLIETSTKPTGDPLPKEGRIILAHGTATGHHHAVEGAGELYAVEGTQDRLLVLPSIAVLTHEEHDHIPLPAGSYIVRRQREYHPEELRNVQD